MYSTALKCKNEWSKHFDGKSPIDVIYLDFSKAFDSVSLEKLLLKLSAYGINGFCLNWIRSFLSNRSQRVKIGQTLSNVVPVTSGVPQGSVLGPTLFLLFINDLCDYFENTTSISLFADDVKLFDLSRNFFALQENLNRIIQWSDIWQLSISLDKCCVLHLGKSNPKNPYFMRDTELPHDITEFKDLGVYITHDLSSNAHCDYITKKSMKTSNLILKAFHSKNTDLLVRAFKTYVRPVLEYSSVVWNPCLLKDIDLVERVQRRFTKCLFRDKTITYKERLALLNLESLELRRLHNDLMMVYSIVKNNILPINDFFTIVSNTNRASNSCKLYLTRFRCNARKFDLCNRVTDIWNDLPQRIIDSRNVKIFSTHLKQLNLNNFIRGRM